MSRKPKPIELKMIAGNPGRRPLPDPIDKEYSGFTMPDWFDEIARDEWARIIPELERMGVLDNVDEALIIAYCSSYSIFIKAQEKALNMEADFTPGAMNWHSVANKNFKIMKDICSEFGMSPSSRARIAPARQKKKDEEWEDLLS
jgi:P27 family predicted phage terminase small subunit